MNTAAAPLGTAHPYLPVHPVSDNAGPQAHRIRLYSALDTLRAPLGATDIQAVFDIAELDAATVQTVIGWITGPRTTGPSATPLPPPLPPLPPLPLLPLPPSAGIPPGPPHAVGPPR